MTIYTALYWLVTIVGIAAACGAAYLLHLLWTTHLSMGSLHSWLDEASDEYADYTEDEQERRTAIYHGDPDASSLRRWYGIGYLVERRLFLVQYSAACVLYRWRDASQHAAARERHAYDHRTF